MLAASILLLALLPPADLQGTVRAAATGDAVPYATVRVVELRRSASTDASGAFVIRGVPEGRWRVQARAIGYRPTEAIVRAGGGQVLRVDFDLVAAPVPLAPVEVTGSRPPPPAAPAQVPGEPRADRLDGRDVAGVPALAEPDVMRAVQALPAVAAASDFSSALYVRGGSPDQTLVTLDGAPLFNPYHLGGLLGAVDPSTVASVDVLPGAFPARVGDRLSGVVDIRTRDGGRDRVRGNGAVSLISARAGIDGPLPSGQGSYIASVRRTHVDAFTGAAYALDLIPGHHPLRVRRRAAEAHARRGRRRGGVGVGVRGRRRDRHAVAAEPGDRQRRPVRLGVAAGHRLLPAHPEPGPGGRGAGGCEPLRRDLRRVGERAGAGRAGGAGAGGPRRYAQPVRGGGADPAGAAKPSPRGGPGRRLPDAAPAGRRLQRVRRRAGPAGAQRPATHPGGVRGRRVGAHLRAQRARGPARAARGRAGDGVDAARGRAVGAAAGAGAVAGGRPLRAGDALAARRGVGALVGARLRPAGRAPAGRRAADGRGRGPGRGVARGGTRVRVDAYARWLHGLPLPDITADPLRSPLLVPGGFRVGEGRTRGVELLARHVRGRSLLSLSYALAFADRRVDGQTFTPRFERRHTLDALALVPLGARGELNARLGLATGQPYTPMAGVAQGYVYDPVTRQFIADGTATLLMGEHNSARLPGYLRLDLGARRDYERRWFGARTTLTPYVHVINVLNTRNVLFARPQPDPDSPAVVKYVLQIPFFPTVGLEWKF